MSITPIKPTMSMDCLCNVMSFLPVYGWLNMFVSFKGLFEYMNSRDNYHPVCRDRVFKILNELKEDEIKTELSYLELLKYIVVVDNFLMIFFKRVQLTEIFVEIRAFGGKNFEADFRWENVTQIKSNSHHAEKRMLIKKNLCAVEQKTDKDMYWYYVGRGFTRFLSYFPREMGLYEQIIKSDVKKPIKNTVQVCMKDKSFIILLNNIFGKCGKEIIRWDTLNDYDSAIKGLAEIVSMQENDNDGNGGPKELKSALEKYLKMVERLQHLALHNLQ